MPHVAEMLFEGHQQGVSASLIPNGNVDRLHLWGIPSYYALLKEALPHLFLR